MVLEYSPSLKSLKGNCEKESTKREYEVRERIPHVWPYSAEKYLKSIIRPVSCCVVISKTTPYWSVITKDKNNLLSADSI